MSARPARVQRSFVARLRPFWLLFAVLIVAAAAVGYWAAAWPGFRLERLTVVGNRIVPTDQIVQRAGIVRGANVWTQNISAAAQRVAAIPYIGNVSIVRSLPANVQIIVTERSPFAVVDYQGRFALVDRDLRVLQYAGASGALPVIISQYVALPHIGSYVRDSSIAQLTADYQTLRAHHVITRKLSYDRFGDLVVQTDAGVQLLLGDDSDLPRKAALAGPILAQVQFGGKRVSAIDLRAHSTPVVRYR